MEERIIDRLGRIGPCNWGSSPTTIGHDEWTGGCRPPGCGTDLGSGGHGERRASHVAASTGRDRKASQVGWDVCVIATPSGTKFVDAEQLARLTGHVVRHDYKQPDEPDVLPPADAMAVAPATFNTINKWAAGISDTLALGLLNEAL
jgi:hypothetical protein